MQNKELAEEMGFEVLLGMVDWLWVVGEPYFSVQEGVEKEIGILTEVDTTTGLLSAYERTEEVPTTAVFLQVMEIGSRPLEAILRLIRTL